MGQGTPNQVSIADEQAARAWIYKRQLYGKFPQMKPFQCTVLGAIANTFNCIAWTMDYPKRHAWPVEDDEFDWPLPPPYADDPPDCLDPGYLMLGFACCYLSEPAPYPDAIDVAIYCKDGYATHGAIRIGDGPWSSKLGMGGPVVEHALSEAEGGDYGNVHHFLRRWPRT